MSANSAAADINAVGTPFLANPDLVRGYRDDPPLNVADPAVPPCELN
jgi:N-ethylmaleimide reductase